MWKEYLAELAFNNAVGALLIALSDPKVRKKYEPAFLKVFRAIKIVFPNFE